MISPVLFYHQFHPVKADTTQTADAITWSMPMNIVAPLFLAATYRQRAGTPRELPHSLDMATSLTGNKTSSITPSPNRTPNSPSRAP